MKNPILIYCLFGIIISCSNLDKRAYFQVYNDTNDTIQHLSISNGNNKETLPYLNPNGKEDIFLKFENVPRTDGGYQIKYQSNSKDYHRNFGYFSNGTPTNSLYKITIKKDTVLIREQSK